MVESCCCQTWQHRIIKHEFHPSLWHQTHILILSCDFQLFRLPWISYTIFLSLIHLSFPSHLFFCFLYPVYFYIHPSFLDSDIILMHFSSPLLSISIVCHSWNQVIILLFVLCFPHLLFLCIYWKVTSTGFSLTTIHLCCISPMARCGGLGLHAVVNPAASACLTPVTSLAGQPEVAHTETHEREQTPDVAMTETMPESCGIKTWKPLDYSSIF